jgi:uncharacterized protein YndB with AHSA1/START domain
MIRSSSDSSASTSEGDRVPTPTGIDRTAPVISELEIDITAPRDRVWKLHTDIAAWPTWQTDISETDVGRELAPGKTFRWTTFGMTITSTVYAVDAGSRLLWGANLSGITGIHEWTFTDTPTGVRVGTKQSLSGVLLAAGAGNVQKLVDQALLSWLRKLKAKAESAR